jgi:hypothetical protein
MRRASFEQVGHTAVGAIADITSVMDGMSLPTEMSCNCTTRGSGKMQLGRAAIG